MRDDVKRVIETGYDAMADRFAAWQREIEGSTRIERVEALLALLPKQPDILELGVGAGVQSSRLLAEGAGSRASTSRPSSYGVRGSASLTRPSCTVTSRNWSWNRTRSTRSSRRTS